MPHLRHLDKHLHVVPDVPRRPERRRHSCGWRRVDERLNAREEIPGPGTFGSGFFWVETGVGLGEERGEDGGDFRLERPAFRDGLERVLGLEELA